MAKEFIRFLCILVVSILCIPIAIMGIIISVFLDLITDIMDITRITVESINKMKDNIDDFLKD